MPVCCAQGKPRLAAQSLQDGVRLSDCTQNAECVVVSDGAEPFVFSVSASQRLQKIDILAVLSVPLVSLQKPCQLKRDSARRNAGKGLCENCKKSVWPYPKLSAVCTSEPLCPDEHFSLVVMLCLGEILLLGHCWGGSLAAQNGGSKRHALISP